MRRPHETRDDGAAAVEFALIAPILLLLLFGIVDFGRAYQAKVELSHASREGARVYALSRDVEQARCAVRRAASTIEDPDPDGDRCTGPFSLADVDIAPAGCAGTSDFGDLATVSVTLQFEYHTPLPTLVTALLPGAVFDNPISLEEQGAMRCGG